MTRSREKPKRGSLFNDIPRGVIEQEGRARTLEEQTMSAAAFMATAAIRKSRLLRHGGDKIFLGAIDADVEERRRPNGEPDFHALGGHLVGAGDDRHMITVAGSRAGKGRSG